jgi:surface polysaccharide O-acyltransferase-like enzyme
MPALLLSAAALTAAHGVSVAAVTVSPLFLMSSGILLLDSKLDRRSNALLSVIVAHFTANLLAAFAVAFG